MVKSGNFHEKLPKRLELTCRLNAPTGLVFAGVALIVAVASPEVLWLGLAVAIGLAAISLFAPVLLRPLNILWFHRSSVASGQKSHRNVCHVRGSVRSPWRYHAVLADPLRSRRTMGSTYWIERGSSGDTGSMTNEF